MSLISRFYQSPEDSYFIFGPRGTGKSTWLKQNFENAYFIDLLDEVTFRHYLAHPEYLKQVVDGNPDIKYFVIDEVQKIPKILDSIHYLIEAKKPQQFIMTGSSARKLRREGVNLLGGRAVLTHFHPYMAAELGSKFNLEEALCWGNIPLIVGAKNPQQKLEAYISLYLKEEVHAEGLVRNIGAFSRFLESISFSHGSILNMNNIARECQVSRKLVENYISILEDLMLAYTVPVFTRRAKRETVAHPKFYLFDCGVYNILRPKGPLDRFTEINGIALEGLVLANLQAWCDYSGEQSRCYYWRTKGGSEVDLIVYGPNYFYAIEIKNSSLVHTTDLKSLKTFKLDYPESTPLVLYRGKDKLLIDNILCLPVEDFLLKLVPKQWPEN
jgi:predicted AAA+ superfamily ATPase